MEEPEDFFKISYSPGFPEILESLSASLAISTYQAGKVVILSSLDGKRVGQLPRHFRKPMGIALDGRKMAIATLREVEVLANAPKLARKYPVNPGAYDGLFMPRATYYTGQTDLHDLTWINNELIAVNTSFSCLCKISHDYGFQPIWQPDFITDLMPQDRCHLNGMAVRDGKPYVVSALGKSDQPGGWRENIAKGGILIDVESKKVLFDELPMPHSPRYHEGFIYVLLSATGELLRIDPDSGKSNIMATLPGLIRGCTILGDYMFIGMSKIRKSSKSFSKLPIREKATQCGVYILSLSSGAVLAHLHYLSNVEEIYDVQVLPGLKCPGIVSPDNVVHEESIHAPELDFWKIQKDEAPDPFP